MSTKTTHVLFDADNTLFASETAAHEATAEVANRYLERIGDPRRFDAETISELTQGKNFRIVARELAGEQPTGITDEEVEEWGEEEIDAVTAHLCERLTVDERILGILEELAAEKELAVVTSSATRRLGGCLEATGLTTVFPEGKRYSADDSMDEATTKPQPDVYQHALADLGIRPEEAVAVEDSTTGTTSAVRAGLKVIGILHHLPEEEHEERRRDLLGAGAAAVATDWDELRSLLR